MIPLLNYVRDGRAYPVRQVIEAMAQELQISPEDRVELLPSKKQARFDNRVHWAASYMKQAGLMASSRRGLWEISEEGRRVLQSGIKSIDRDFLLQYPSFRNFATATRTTSDDRHDTYPVANDKTPEELIELSHNELNQQLATDLLELIQGLNPQFFEQLVVDLLLAMGYGSSLGYGQRIGQTGDGGIDGYIQEDKLGLETIYIQAKRWGSGHVVGRPDIQAFVGSLASAGADKGVFLTTSTFSQHAREYARALNQYKVILIDGVTLTALMIEHNVGVATQKTYLIKRIDSDYFRED